MIELIVAAAFSIIMLIWNIYLMRQNNTLVNKLMSRNYNEYVGAESFMKNKPKESEENKIEEVVDPFDEQRARDLNAMMGMG